MPASDFVDQEVLEGILKNTAPAIQLANAWVALYTVAPSKSGGGTEVTGNGYARVQTDISDWSVTGPPYVGANINGILFPMATPAGWGTIVAGGLFDAATVGNLLFYNTLTSPEAVGAGDVFVFAVSAFTITGA